MKRINMKKLLNTMFATKVRAAWDSHELRFDNVVAWVKEYNGGMYDAQLEREVVALIKHFNNF